MITNNSLDKSFGTVGSTSGVIVFIAGVILSCLYISALILVLIGAFVGFTTSSAMIDYGRKRVKFSNNIFGIIRIGKWMSIEPSMKIGITDPQFQSLAYRAKASNILFITDTTHA